MNRNGISAWPRGRHRPDHRAGFVELETGFRDYSGTHLFNFIKWQSQFRHLRLRLDKLHPNAGSVSPLLRISRDMGASYDSGVSDYTTYGSGDITTGNAAQVSIGFTTALTNSANSYSWAELDFFNIDAGRYPDGSIPTYLYPQLAFRSFNFGTNFSAGAGIRNAAGRFDAIQIFSGSNAFFFNYTLMGYR